MKRLFVVLLAALIFIASADAQFLRRDLTYISQKSAVVLLPGHGIVVISSKSTLPADLRPEALSTQDTQAIFLKYSKIDDKGSFSHLVLSKDKTFQMKAKGVASFLMQGVKISYNHGSDVLFITDERESSSPSLVILHGDQVVGNTSGIRWATLLDVAQGLPDGFRYRLENQKLHRGDSLVEDPIIGDVFSVDNPCQMQGRLAFASNSVDEYTKSGTLTEEMKIALRRLRAGEIVNSFENVTILSVNPTSIVVVNKSGELLVAEPVSTKLESLSLCAFYAVTH